MALTPEILAQNRTLTQRACDNIDAIRTLPRVAGASTMLTERATA